MSVANWSFVADEFDDLSRSPEHPVSIKATLKAQQYVAQTAFRPVDTV
jgi:hypothetical protein